MTDVTPRLAEGLSDMYLAQDLRHDRKAALKPRMHRTSNGGGGYPG